MGSRGFNDTRLGDLDDLSVRQRMIRAALAALGVLLGIFLIFLILVGLFGRTQVPRGEIGLSYGGGLIEGNGFQGIKHSGPKFFNGIADALYTYPTGQRTFGFADDDSADIKGTIKVTTKDKITIELQPTAYFKLNTTPDVLRRFHEDLGYKTQAWNFKQEGGGWDVLLRENLQRPLEQASAAAAQRFTIDQLQAQGTGTLAQAIGADTTAIVKANVGADYFCGPSFNLTTGECPPLTVTLKPIKLPAEITASAARIKAAANNKRAAIDEAAAVKIAAGSGLTGYAYVLNEALKDGKVQGVWPVPVGTGVTVTPPRQP